MTRSSRATKALRALGAALMLIIGVLVSFGPLASPVGAAEPAFNFVNDEQGLNDPGTNVSAQNDLTRMGRDDTTSGGLHVTWSWDKVDFSGGNTGNACALLDTDADGSVNFVVCVEVIDDGSGVAVQVDASPYVFSCNDARTDRCGQPSAVTQVGETDCAVTTTPTDPFVGGEAYPNDTTATCSIDLTAPGFGGRTAQLLNVCSYSSVGSGGNTNPFDCIVTPGAGFLNILKEASPDDGTEFVIQASAAANNSEQQWTVVGSGDVLLVPYQPTAALDLAEVVPSGWQLDAATCLIGNVTTGIQTDAGVDNLEIRSGQETTCTFTNSLAFVAPELTVEKTANPTAVSEPGGDVTFTIVVTNNAPAGLGDAELDVLDDDIHGDLTTKCVDTDGRSLIGRPLPGGGSLTCTFSVTITGNPDDFETDTVTATASNDAGSDTKSDTATVTISDVPSVIAMTKTADPTDVTEPGGDVTFTFTVKNDSVVDEVTIDSLSDTVYGDLNGEGNCSVPQTIAAGGSYSCSITEFVSSTETNIATASGLDDDGNPVSDEDNATVTLNDSFTNIVVTKTADPESVPEPGGDVTFTVTIDNPSKVDSVQITSLTDSIYGDLNGQGSCLVPQTIAVEGSYNCSFTATVLGNAGDIETDIATASGVDEDGVPVSDDDEATVTVDDVQPAIAVVKTAEPTSVEEPGGDVAFTVVVTNDSITSDPVTITSLTDDIHGDLNGQGSCSVPQTIAPGDDYTCSFTVLVLGDPGDTETDIVTASGTDDEGNPISEQGKATVTIDDVASSIEVIKTAGTAADGEVHEIPENGGPVKFSVAVNNTSLTDLVRIDTLTDSIHGDLNGQGDCAVPQDIAAGDSYSCTFSAEVSGNAGYQETNVVTASGLDDDGMPVSDTDDAVVVLTDLPSSIEVLKTANPTSVDEPGGDVTYTFVVNNLSAADSVTIDSLTDSILGDLDGEGDCSMPRVIAVGGSYDCSVTVFVGGNANDTILNEATASGTDDDGNPVSDDDDARVTIADVESSIEVTKTADPASVPETGGDVTFTISVENTSTVDTVTIESVEDSVFGDVSASCAPALPVDLLPGETVVCTFTEFLSGQAETSHTDTATATGEDDDGKTVEGEGTAEVPFVDVLPDITVTKTADPDSVPETGGNVTFTFLVTNNSQEEATLDGLVDDVLGDLDGEGDCSVPQPLAGAGGVYSCSVTAFVSGDASGPAHENEVTAKASDDDGNTDEDSDTAEVTFDDVLPDVSITKTADPTSIDEPGGDVEFTIVVTNDGLEDVTIDSLTDSDFDLATKCPDAAGTVLSESDTYTCAFTGSVAGNFGTDHENTATVVASDDDGNSDTESDTAEVEILDVPSSIEVTKTADPASVPEPGGAVRYTYTVTNTSEVDFVTINSLVDDQIGDLNGRGSCETPQAMLAPGDSYTCRAGRFVRGNAGDSVTNVVTATGVDDDGGPVYGQARALVTVSNSQPSVTVKKSADQAEVLAPGEEVTFSVEIENTSGGTDPVTVNGLRDSVHADAICIDDAGDDVIGKTIAPGETLSCTFVAFVDGTQTNTVTVGVTDDENTSVRGTSNDVTVRFVNPSLSIEKTTNGADDQNILVDTTLTWAYVVTNDGDVTIRDIAVSDDMGVAVTCPGTTLEPGESFTCTAEGIATEDLYINVGTATGGYTDPDGDLAEPSAADQSSYFGAAPSISITKEFADDEVIAGGDPSSFTIVVTNEGNVPLRNVRVLDTIDERLVVTNVTGTQGQPPAPGSNPSVLWRLGRLEVGESATVTVEFEVDGATTPADGVRNRAVAVGVFVDDLDNRGAARDVANDTIDIVSGVDLSIDKEFEPDAVSQGTDHSFTIVVSNAGVLTAKNVAVTDTVPAVLPVTGVAVTSGEGLCSHDGQAIDCIVSVPGDGSVTIEVTYTVLPFLDGDPSYGTDDGSEFRFVFVNGSILEGSAVGDVFLDGALIDDAGRTKNDYYFDPPGDDPPFLLHLSCSDAFPGGWGDSGGPDEGTDEDWQVAAYSIVRYKKGEFFRKCGDVVVPFDVLNTAVATWEGPAETVEVSDEATVRIGPGVAVERIRVNNRRLTVWLNNGTGAEQGIKSIDLDWPETRNGDLERASLNDERIFQGSIGSPAELQPDGGGWELEPGENILRFDFDNRSASSGYELLITFDDDTTLEVTL